MGESVASVQVPSSLPAVSAGAQSDSSSPAAGTQSGPVRRRGGFGKTGRVIARLIHNGDMDIDLDPYRVLR